MILKFHNNLILTDKVNKSRIVHNFLRPKNPSAQASPLYEIEIRALAGRAMKSMRVRPVRFPAECFPVLFSFPLVW